MTDALKLFFLAVLQGVAEFLPVSSSSHLALAGKLIGLDVPGVRVELALHAGTLVAVLAYYRVRVARVVAGVFRGERGALLYAAALLAGCVPAAAAYFLFGDWIASRLDGSWRLTGAMLVVTGLLLLSSRLVRDAPARPLTLWRALLVGVAQACALVPGISRSGATIILARFLSVGREEAVEFSFMASAPLVAGGVALELLHPSAASSAAPCPPGWRLLVPAAALSAAVGCLAIRLLAAIVRKGRFWIFGFYCVPAGLAILLAA